MSVFDDLKDSLNGSDRSNNSSGNNSFDSDFSSDLDSDLDMDSGPSTERTNSPPRQEPQDSPRNPQSRTSEPNNQMQGGPRQTRNRGQNRSQNPGQNSQRQNSVDTPNAQAGRPQKGSPKPQLSGQTQRKMENAGLEQNTRSGGQGQTEPVSNQRSDFEELKAQNEQIIELLKRLNQSLNNGRHQR